MMLRRLHEQVAEPVAVQISVLSDRVRASSISTPR
jgi:hypothetical protein